MRARHKRVSRWVWFVHLLGLLMTSWAMMWAFTMGYVGAGIVLSACWLGVFYLAATDELPRRPRGGRIVSRPRPDDWVRVRLDNGSDESGESNMTEREEG